MKNLIKNIIKEKKRDELVKLNAVEIVNQIFSELQERERDVLSRRFALGGHSNVQTLEEIGKMHSLTRERVRQIESSSLEKIKKLDTLDKEISAVRVVIEEILNEHGGMMEREFLLDVLSVLTLQLENEDTLTARSNYKNYFDFILSNLLNDYIEKVNTSKHFLSFYKIKNNTVDYLEDLVSELKDKILDIKRTVKFDEILDMLKGFKSFNFHKDKILKNEELDLTSVFKDKVFPEKGEIINQYKPFYSVLRATKDIGRNKFGYWGYKNWSEIKPKRIADKIFLILKEEQKPLHFSEITKKINEAGFDHKKANVGSVHNELILDDRYVLIDRGVYGLKAWQK